VHLLLAVKNGLEVKIPADFSITAREFSETVKLLDSKTTTPYQVIGSHYGKSVTKKAIGLLSRFVNTYRNIGPFDVSLSCGSESAVWISALKRKKSIAFGDNDLAKQWTYSAFVTKAFFPKSIPTEVLLKQGLNSRKLYQYDGFKEHIYIADYIPDPLFRNTVPFDKFVVVRPENVQANYVNGSNVKSLVPELLKQLSERGENIIYLPRYDIDREYSTGIRNLFIPDKPLNGLDLCYYSRGVFTGAGTFAREAACMGVPSFSFFLGSRLLAVDQDLVNQSKMFYSRNPSELVNSFLNSERRLFRIESARSVRDEVIYELLKTIQ